MLISTRKETIFLTNISIIKLLLIDWQFVILIDLPRPFVLSKKNPRQRSRPPLQNSGAGLLQRTMQPSIVVTTYHNSTLSYPNLLQTITNFIRF
jgi:hypothetical protein